MEVCCKFMSTESSALLIIGLNGLRLCLFWYMTYFEKFLSSFPLVEFIAFHERLCSLFAFDNSYAWFIDQFFTCGHVDSEVWQF